MELNKRYNEIFGKVPIFGMIHLASENKIKRALEEIVIFEEQGVDGAIIENYHGEVDDVIETLQEISKIKPQISIGVNILPNEFYHSLELAEEYGADFIQLDHVAGKYERWGELNFNGYKIVKEKHNDIMVFGGVWPKYYRPILGSFLERDLKTGMERAEAIVVTGEGTGIETPIEKIKEFREILGNHPLIIGAGLNLENAYEQLKFADGAIVGSCFKIGENTRNQMDKYKVRDFMKIVNEVRKYKIN